MHLAQMIFRNEALYGDQPAFDFHDRRWSWRETAGRVRRLAAATRGLGLQTNDTVAVLSLNNTVYCESWFGLPLAGLRIVPLNIRLAVPEWQYLLTNSESRALLFDEAMQPGVEALRDADVPVEHYLFIGDPAQCPDWATSIESLMQAAEPFNEELTADQSLLGIMYTGGTTGLPKGVMLRHSALYLNAMACREHIHVPADGVQLLAAPLFHIAGFTSMTLSVMSGARTVIHESFDPKRVIADCGRHAATNLTLVPAMIQLTFDHPDFTADQFASLKTLLYGASPMSEGLMRRVMGALPNLKLAQIYGQTEQLATIMSPHDHLRASERPELLKSAGRAMCSTAIKVIDEDGDTLPRGDIGEICLLGPNAMLGYWNKPDETAKTIIDGWVHTGDAGYLDSDGYLFLVDRVKDMIVSGGENVYSSEVESVLSTHPDVVQVAVIGIPDDKWGEAVHAIVIPREGAEENTESIIAHCKERIAGYKCPRGVTFRHEPMPLSGAGKVLKRELRAPYWEGKGRMIN